MAPADPKRAARDPQETAAPRGPSEPRHWVEDDEVVGSTEAELGEALDLWSDVTPAEPSAPAAAVRVEWPMAEPEPPAGPRKVPRRDGRTAEPTFAPVRRYPKMWALVDDREAARVAAGVPPPPPVPGTFFPSATRMPERPQVSDLDDMLSAMAEGLLVGETADGHAEVRVTLRDEFFAGTELRLVSTDEGLTAALAPPDRETYWLLAGTQHELVARLTERGLRLKDIEVLKP